MKQCIIVYFDHRHSFERFMFFKPPSAGYVVCSLVVIRVVVAEHGAMLLGNGGKVRWVSGNQNQAALLLELSLSSLLLLLLLLSGLLWRSICNAPWQQWESPAFIWKSKTKDDFQVDWSPLLVSKLFWFVNVLSYQQQKRTGLKDSAWLK